MLVRRFFNVVKSVKIPWGEHNTVLVNMRWEKIALKLSINNSSWKILPVLDNISISRGTELLKSFECVHLNSALFIIGANWSFNVFCCSSDERSG